MPLNETTSSISRRSLSFWLEAADTRAGGLLRWLAFRPYAAVVALTLLCCALYLPGIASLPVTDRDEARFSQASKQMLETGNAIDIRFQNEPRYKKPIGIYWLQSAAVTAAQTAGAALNDIWAYRIPSFLGALGAVLLLFWAARPVIGRQAALIAAGLFAASLTLSLESRIAKSDAALMFSVMLMQGALFRLYLSQPGARTQGLAALFWIAAGLSILLKGPVGPSLALLTAIVVLWRDKRRVWLRHLHWRWGIPLLLVITLPWFIAIGIQSGGAFFKSSLGQDFAGKLASGQEKHWGPPGFYFILFWAIFWPGVLFITTGAVASLWRVRNSRRILFLLGWIVPFWIMIEAIPTKLPHYALPLFPAFAIVAALMLKSPWLREFKQASRWRMASVLWGGLVVFHIAALAGLAYAFEADYAIPRGMLLGVYAALALLTLASAWRAYSNLTPLAAIASAVIFYNLVFVWGLPQFKPLWISERVYDAAMALQACGNGEPIALTGYSEPSAIFLNGTATLLAPVATTSEALAAGRVKLAFISQAQSSDFETRFMQSAGSAPVNLGCVDGFNMNGRGPTRLYVYAHPKSRSIPGCEPVRQTTCLEKNEVRWRRLTNSKF